MTGVSVATGYAQPTALAARPAGRSLTLADQHLRLLSQVTARAGQLLTAASHGRWPGAELAALVGCARAEVLRQASEEETLLFPASPSHAAARLARDHARLRSGIELLARAAAGEQHLSPAQIAAATRDFVTQLERHLSIEERLLNRWPDAGHPPVVAQAALLSIV